MADHRLGHRDPSARIPRPIGVLRGARRVPVCAGDRGVNGVNGVDYICSVEEWGEGSGEVEKVGEQLQGGWRRTWRQGNAPPRCRATTVCTSTVRRRVLYRSLYEYWSFTHMMALLALLV